MCPELSHPPYVGRAYKGKSDAPLRGACIRKAAALELPGGPVVWTPHFPKKKKAAARCPKGRAGIAAEDEATDEGELRPKGTGPLDCHLFSAGQ